MTIRIFQYRTLMTVLWLLVVACSYLPAQISPVQIEGIRRKAVISQADTDTITTFVKEQLNNLVKADNSKDLDDITRNLVSNSVSINAQVRKAYSDAYCEALRGAYKPVLARAEKIQDSLKSARIQLQVIISLSLADNILLVDELLDQMSNTHPDIRYWVVSSFLQPTVQNYLQGTTTESQEIARRIAAKLSADLDNETSTMVLSRIAIFATNTAKMGESIDLLKKWTAKRLAAYKDWSVSDEQSDWDVLKTIFDTVHSGNLRDFKERESAVMRCAAELYTAAFLRFSTGARYSVKGAGRVSLIDDQSTMALMTILIEGEKNLLVLSGNRRAPRVPAELAKSKWNTFPAIISTLVGPTGDIQQVYSIYTPDEITNKTPLVKLDEPGEVIVAAGVNRTQTMNNLMLPGVNK